MADNSYLCCSVRGFVLMITQNEIWLCIVCVAGIVRRKWWFAEFCDHLRKVSSSWDHSMYSIVTLQPISNSHQASNKSLLRFLLCARLDYAPEDFFFFFKAKRSSYKLLLFVCLAHKSILPLAVLIYRNHQRTHILLLHHIKRAWHTTTNGRSNIIFGLVRAIKTESKCRSSNRIFVQIRVCPIPER